jgi:ParB family chromosome partitioning protein
VARITPSPYQPRREIDPNSVALLAESIRSEGLLQPIVVREMDKGSYQLIAGERRLRAHQHLGVPRIMARVMDASDASAAVLSLIENLQREGLNPIEIALGYASLMSDFDLTQEAVAERVGRARASVANSLRLLALDRELQGYLARGLLSTGHAKVLLGVEDSQMRALLARRCIEENLSVRDLERLVKKLREPGASGHARTPRLSGAENQAITSLEQSLCQHLNTKVQLKHTPKKGKLIIEYYGNEDLQRILEKTGLQSL